MSRTSTNGKFSSYMRLASIGFTFLAVVSPLYIDRRQMIIQEDDELPINLAVLLPLLLFILIVSITVSRFIDQSLTRFDLYWIHRVGGSSVGITLLLLVLTLILMCKASIRNWES